MTLIYGTIARRIIGVLALTAGLLVVVSSGGCNRYRYRDCDDGPRWNRGGNCDYDSGGYGYSNRGGRWDRRCR